MFMILSRRVLLKILALNLISTQLFRQRCNKIRHWNLLKSKLLTKWRAYYFQSYRIDMKYRLARQVVEVIYKISKAILRTLQQGIKNRSKDSSYKL